jgi:endonuclease/exonuclease/phosphatase (EEP) superfamily protein YafD
MIVVAVPAVALAVVSVAAFFGKWSWVLDVAANFRVQYAVALIGLAALLLVRGWKKTALVAALGAVVNLFVIVPLFIGHGTTIPPENPLRVMSFNLYDSNERFADVISFIRQEDPDVVFLHEASLPWEVAIDSANLGYEITKSRSPELIFGTLVLTRPGDKVTSFGFTTGGARAVEVIHGDIAILGVHALSPTDAERAALRNAQLKFAADWANRQEGLHIVTGDFNATPWSYPFRRLVASTGLHNSQTGYGIEASFPTTWFFALRVPIDHLLYSDGLAVSDRRLGPALGSDHYPLIVDLWVPG